MRNEFITAQALGVDKVISGAAKIVVGGAVAVGEDKTPAGMTRNVIGGSLIMPQSNLSKELRDFWTMLEAEIIIIPKALSHNYKTEPYKGLRLDQIITSNRVFDRATWEQTKYYNGFEEYLKANNLI